MNNKIIALLPMKANSERVKGKNFKDFCGKPLYRWVLDALLEVKDIDTVIINTDAREILKDYGLIESEKVIIRDRNKEICGDLVSMNLVIEDDLRNTNADIYVMTHTTNPLMSADVIYKALRLFKDKYKQGLADSLFTVNKVQTRFYRYDGSAVNHDPDNLIRTQDLEPWYEENSNLYIFSRSGFFSTNARIGKRPIMYEMSKIESIDIDTHEDWDLAVMACKCMENNKH